MGYGREMDGCGQFMKYSLFLANILIFVGGCVVLGIGVWTLVDKAQMNALLGTNLFLGAAYILIVTGAVVILIAFFGCLGAIREIKCMLLLYFMLVFLVFVTMLVGGILGYVFREKVGVTMEQEMQRSLSQYRGGEQHKETTDAWDYIQQNVKCCGVTGPSNWISYGGVPASCCKQRVLNSAICTAVPTNIYDDGCLEKTVKFVKDHAATLGGAGVGVACLMILGMIFSCALFNMIE
ncbi:tetraspanin-11 [Bacillus rossius redtenbacheri]|uniref:tetraspanin-11 n=1 Tax=Bacillus rossius redtenbacheri TaxID=93214 RepID=UPI002FDEB72D